MRLQCVRGPYDGQVRDVDGRSDRYVLADDVGFRGVYQVATIAGELRLVFDAASAPAWATEEHPVVIEHAGRRYPVWTSPLDGVLTKRWMIRDGERIDELTEAAVDVDTTLEALRRWVMAKTEARR